MWQHEGQKIVESIAALARILHEMSPKGVVYIYVFHIYIYIYEFLVILVCLRVKRPPNARLFTIVHKMGEVHIFIFWNFVL